MPTLHWIQETRLDRYHERGSSGSEKIDTEYPCRVCGMKFVSISERDHHEVNHPVLNPTIFIDGKEICGDSISITSPAVQDAIYVRNVEFLSINGIYCRHKDDLAKKISKEKRAFFDVRYGNSNIEKRLKVNICIADTKEIEIVESMFARYFEKDNWNESDIVVFTEKVRNLHTVQSYSDGLLRYLQGLMVKDSRSENKSFDTFVERFNQATSALRLYKTGLSKAVNAVVDFNRNDFAVIDKSGVPLLDCAIDFFRGGELREIGAAEAPKVLPVDYATEWILTRLLFVYKNGCLADLESEIAGMSPKYLTLQDKTKFAYICWRKSIQENNSEAERRYAKSLRYDEVFSGLVE